MVTAMVVPTLALTTTNANPSVTVPTGTPTSVGISYVWSGTSPADTLAIGTTFTVNIPAGFSWSATPTFASAPVGAITLSGPVAANGGLTQTWTLATFPSGSWTLTLAGGMITTSNTSGTAPVTLMVGAAAPVQIARLTASGTTAGSLVPIVISPTAVPADGISTTRIAFGAVAITCATHTTFTVGTTAGTFIATTLPGATLGSTSVTVPCANFLTVNGATLTLRAPTTAVHATVSVVLSLVAGGSFTDSSTNLTFGRPAGAEGGGGHDGDHGAGQGARKTGLFAAGLTTAGCVTAGAVPAPGATSFGFAVIKTTGHGRLNVTVALKGAVPNATFTVAVNQGGTCSAPFTIHTNGAGNGTGHQHLALVQGAKSFWVTASTSSATYVSKALTVPAKHKGHGHGHDNRGDKGHGHDNRHHSDD